METVFEDPEFGAMHFDLFWEGASPIEGLGDVVHIRIDSELSPPSTDQRNRLSEFARTFQSIRPYVEIALFQYYTTVRDEYVLSYTGTSALESVPELATASEIWTLLSDPAVFVTNHDDQIVVRWECEWDIEHGIEVVLERGKVLSVGIQESH